MTTEVSVQPCFSGPFRFPDGYDTASPIYMMKESNSLMQKQVRIEMKHHADLEDEEDCKNMVFLSGHHVMEGRGQQYYKFNHALGENVSFEVGESTGAITVPKLTPLCIAKKKGKHRCKCTTGHT